MKREDSLKKRYFFKLTTNIIGGLVGMVTLAIVPRALGPTNYGNFTFVTQFFQQLISFYSVGSSIGFFTKLSQRNHDKGLIGFYGLVMFVVFALLLMTVIGVISTGYAEIVWPEQDIIIVVAGLVFALLMWGLQTCVQIADAFALTISVELIKLVQKLLSTIILVIMAYVAILNLETYFLFHYIVIGALIVALIYFFIRRGVINQSDLRLNRNQMSAYIQEFYHYCAPLFIYNIVVLIGGLAQVWMLQHFAGSEQQGFFGLSYQIGAACFLFTSAMTPLLIREMAKAFAQKNKERMRSLFRRYIPMLYSVAAYFAVFISMEADKVVQIFGGEAYTDAIVVVIIMALYPIHQTYGQLSGSVFYATDQTKLYSNIAVTMMPIGLAILYMLLAPTEQFGLELGALGVAINMVGMQFIGVNIQLWFNTKYLGLSFLRFFAHQIVALIFFISLAYVGINIGAWLAGNTSVITLFIMEGFCYTILVALGAYLLPQLFSVTRTEINQILMRVWQRLKPIE